MIAQRALKTLEYDKVRQLVAKHCTCSIGKSAIDELVPETDFEKVVELLDEMDEGLSILRVKGNVPLGGIFDVRPACKTCANWWDAICDGINGSVEYDSCKPHLSQFHRRYRNRNSD